MIQVWFAMLAVGETFQYANMSVIIRAHSGSDAYGGCYVLLCQFETDDKDLV